MLTVTGHKFSEFPANHAWVLADGSVCFKLIKGRFMCSSRQVDGSWSKPEQGMPPSGQYRKARAQG